ncbi:hypothetical protein AB6A40_001106 [Gnathostoma spinigerum]|uniref:Uncharacterized protein n=1 Tax=Gnathostoma spinigerum TaxID=75299 RepID=A0ABD6E5J4_9BILA
MRVIAYLCSEYRTIFTKWWRLVFGSCFLLVGVYVCVNFWEVLLFVFLWAAFITGLFISVRRSLENRSPECASFAASALISCYMFKLIKMHSDVRISVDTLQAQGPPLQCYTSKINLLNWLSSYSCIEYNQLIKSSILWRLDVFHVTSQLFIDATVFLASLFGRILGGFVGGIIAEVSWIYAVLTLLIVTSCIMTTIFASYRCCLSLFYGLFTIEFRGERDNRPTRSSETSCADRLKMRKVLQEEIKPPGYLVHELYQS